MEARPKKAKRTRGAAARKKPATEKARERAAAKRRLRRRANAAVTPKAVASKAAKPAPPPDARVEIRRLRSQRARLEKRLTAVVQEIGILRQYEMRARMLEAEVERKKVEIGALRHEYEERIRALESRSAEAGLASVQGRLL